MYAVINYIYISNFGVSKIRCHLKFVLKLEFGVTRLFWRLLVIRSHNVIIAGCHEGCDTVG